MSVVDDGERAAKAWEDFTKQFGPLSADDVARKDTDTRRIVKATEEANDVRHTVGTDIRPALDALLRRELASLPSRATQRQTSRLLPTLLRVRETVHIDSRLDDFARTRLQDSGVRDAGSAQGRLATYKAERDFGFLRTEGDGRDVWFHVKEMPEQRPPDASALYSFDIEVTEKGRRARRILRVP